MVEHLGGEDVHKCLIFWPILGQTMSSPGSDPELRNRPPAWPPAGRRGGQHDRSFRRAPVGAQNPGLGGKMGRVGVDRVGKCAGASPHESLPGHFPSPAPILPACSHGFRACAPAGGRLWGLWGGFLAVSSKQVSAPHRPHSPPTAGMHAAPPL